MSLWDVICCQITSVFSSLIESGIRMCICVGVFPWEASVDHGTWTEAAVQGGIHCHLSLNYL